MVHVLSTENFEEEVIKEKGTVLVDLYADWCGPCKVLAPTVEAIADEETGLKVGKMNIDQNPDIAEQYGVRSIPTLLLFENGELKEKTVGLQSKAQILNLIKK
ncbi:thioredoxin [Anaerocolumna cellulosilytica]|uniref:Thioredoxin n=1 Tax=Anaerocolumna cellulosilytica TaxID=433286 RepID=A0A6S6R529_9FIRM|nr:thioredoxin [Anaerocolumna cellulosilytica]MBB5194267.1 thioredoxin 1 [Anaerocolumna cellulosilytica]BCJ94520.1 thioredoxin [Anaerocolumna cellulosilytica]